MGTGFVEGVNDAMSDERAPEIRSTKSEIRNKSKSADFQIRDKRLPSMSVLKLDHLNFGIVSDFNIRI